LAFGADYSNAQPYDFDLLSDREGKIDGILLFRGLGNSLYIQSKVQAEYYDRFEVIVENDEQMHLVKGLVQRRVDELKRETNEHGL
jgi:hypothetical protein